MQFLLFLLIVLRYQWPWVVARRSVMCWLYLWRFVIILKCAYRLRIHEMDVVLIGTWILQARGSIMVGASPEILARIQKVQDEYRPCFSALDCFLRFYFLVSLCPSSCGPPISF